MLHSILDADGFVLPDAPDEALRQAQQIEEHDRYIDGGALVAVVRWPEQHTLLEQLRRQGLPRFLLLAADAPPVVADDLLEDWARLPMSVLVLRTRIDRLRRDAYDRPPRPVLDGDGRLLYRSRWIGLSRLQEHIAGPLVAHFEQPVKTRDLDAEWDHDPASIVAFRSCVSGLRQRIRPLSLEVVTVRNYGYLLHARP